MMETDCSIMEDLLPLYNEGLVQDDTATWIEAHLMTCSNCAKLAKDSVAPVETQTIRSPVNHEKMMAKITLKLSFYQVIFVGLSFFFAMQTAILNDSFGFILFYTILGIIMYLFYKRMSIIFLIAFTPIFIWSLGSLIPDIMSMSDSLSTRMGMILTHGVFSSIVLALIHYAFALAGAIIGLFILKIRESDLT